MIFVERLYPHKLRWQTRNWKADDWEKSHCPPVVRIKGILCSNTSIDLRNYEFLGYNFYEDNLLLKQLGYHDGKNIVLHKGIMKIVNFRNSSTKLTSASNIVKAIVNQQIKQRSRK